MLRKFIQSRTKDIKSQVKSSQKKKKKNTIIDDKEC